MIPFLFDHKVVSTTAHCALATFPPRAALLVPSSTLCCLSFADRFLFHYPFEGDSGGDRHELGHALPSRSLSTRIAISADDLDSVVQRAAELGGRLAAALAARRRPKARNPAAAPISVLLAKVRGIFGNRMTCVGGEIHVLRDEKAERDESFLLHQIHALKNAVLDASNNEKWCFVVTSGGESLVICVMPLVLVEGTAAGCDFLVFNPRSRPEMKLPGSYVVKFTTVRSVISISLLDARRVL